jgi:hypothetical protein
MRLSVMDLLIFKFTDHPKQKKAAGRIPTGRS